MRTKKALRLRSSSLRFYAIGLPEIWPFHPAIGARKDVREDHFSFFWEVIFRFTSVLSFFLFVFVGTNSARLLQKTPHWM